MSNKVVSFQNITKRFGEILAVDDVSFDIQKGSVHAIVGENGAGKSTIVKILYGYQQATSGSIKVNDQQVDIEDSQTAINLGIGMVHQHFMLVNAMTVLENILIGYPTLKLGSVIDIKSAIAEIKRKSEEFKLEFNLDEYVRDLSVGTKQRLEIFKTILRENDVLILDEPTSVLTKLEVEDLFRIIKTLQQKKRTVIIITHKLDEVMAISDHVTVMRGGKLIDSMPTKDTSMAELAGLMVGHKIPPPVRPKVKYGETILEVNDLNYTNKNTQIIKNINLTIREGEILGIAGISGNAQSELEQILSGMIVEGISGEVNYRGQNIIGKNAAGFRKKGVAHVPSDRTKWGYVQEWQNNRNGFLGYQFWKRFNKYNFWLREQQIKDFVETMIEKFGVRPQKLNLLTASLSGGNQQKLIVGREISSEPDLLIIAEPTQGVDIGSVAFIHQQMLDAKKKGNGILLISSELNEIKELADRSLIICKGEIVGEIDWDKDDEQKIGLMMIGKQ